VKFFVPKLRKRKEGEYFRQRGGSLTREERVSAGRLREGLSRGEREFHVNKNRRKACQRQGTGWKRNKFLVDVRAHIGSPEKIKEEYGG